MEHSSRLVENCCSVSTQLTVPNTLVVRHRAKPQPSCSVVGEVSVPNTILGLARSPRYTGASAWKALR